jgi:hypothetical protein
MADSKKRASNLIPGTTKSNFEMQVSKRTTLALLRQTKHRVYQTEITRDLPYYH